MVRAFLSLSIYLSIKPQTAPGWGAPAPRLALDRSRGGVAPRGVLREAVQKAGYMPKRQRGRPRRCPARDLHEGHHHGRGASGPGSGTARRRASRRGAGWTAATRPAGQSCPSSPSCPETHSQKRCFLTPPLICKNRPNVRALIPHFATGMYAMDFPISQRRTRPFPHFGPALRNMISPRTCTGSPTNKFLGDTFFPLATGVSPPGTGGTCRFRRRAAAPLGGNLGG